MAKKPGADLATSANAGPKEVKEIQPYETEGHMKTLMDAHDIMGDPEKMDKVHALAGRHSKALKGIQAMKPMKQPKVRNLDDLRAISNKAGGPEDPDAV